MRDFQPCVSLPPHRSPLTCTEQHNTHNREGETQNRGNVNVPANVSSKCVLCFYRLLYVSQCVVGFIYSAETRTRFPFAISHIYTLSTLYFCTKIFFSSLKYLAPTLCCRISLGGGRRKLGCSSSPHSTPAASAAAVRCISTGSDTEDTAKDVDAETRGVLVGVGAADTGVADIRAGMVVKSGAPPRYTQKGNLISFSTRSKRDVDLRLVVFRV